LKDVVTQLAARVPKVIEEMKPIIPKAEEIEARIKEKFEKQWQVRLERVEKQRDTIRSKTEAKYEVEIADLKRKLDEAVRHATLKGGVSDLLSHPLIQKSVRGKLNDKQWAFLELLETKGPQDPEHCSLFLEIKPKSVPDFTYDINRKIPKLIENQGGRYVSRLAKLFPVTAEAKAEANEIEELRQALITRDAIERDLKSKLDAALHEVQEMRQMVARVARERDDLRVKARQVSETRQTSVPSDIPEPATPQPTPINQAKEVHVEATLHRTLTKFNVATNTEVLNGDESTPIGRLLASGLRGFFTEPKRFGDIMNELERKYSIAKSSGGNRQSVQSGLEELVAKDVLDRKLDNNQWVYFATEHFNERVRPFQEVPA
jgi:hypothetical protein